ncbi:MAG TPA: hypothetical protein VH089_26895, partial [Streptosporangiaceae bacterium]|nr:hypothetical protein [Streptosporangiaceae bacterium]
MSDRILLRGGLVADGIGATTRRADVLVEGERIAEVRDAPVGGAHDPAAPIDSLTEDSGPGSSDTTVITLSSASVICPGFIDAHAH